jgi:ABC-2 type transport system ATP-binding protein
MRPEPALRVEGLVKRYGSTRAVDGISFAVDRASVFALLGPNGAGKTTTVEILEGFRVRDDGVVRVLGLDPAQDAAELKARMGVMLQDSGLYLTIRPREALELFARFYPGPRPVPELLRLVGLEEAANTPYRRLSGGQKKRLALALALVGAPEVVFLDEPTAGLDPQARRATWEIIASLRAEGATVLLTTHYLEEAERLADAVAIMDRGRILAVGSPAELMQREQTVVRLRTREPTRLQDLSELPHASSTRQEDGTYLLETGDARALLVEITTLLRDRGIEAIELRVGASSLDDVFLELTGREVRE